MRSVAEEQKFRCVKIFPCFWERASHSFSLSLSGTEHRVLLLLWISGGVFFPPPSEESRSVNGGRRDGGGGRRNDGNADLCTIFFA